MNAAIGMRVEAQSASRAFSRGEPAVSRVSLVLEAGEFAALEGRSGSGKTTLIHLLAGLDRPTDGRVLLDGADLAGVSRAGRTRLTRQMGLVMQSAAVIRRLPVWENVTVGLVPLGVPSRERLEIAVAALERVELERLAWRRPEELSTGERQRVTLARALVHEPRLMFADEPTSNLDPESAGIVCDVIGEVWATGCTVLVATHDEALISRAPRVIPMADGRLCAPRPT